MGDWGTDDEVIGGKETSLQIWFLLIYTILYPLLAPQIPSDLPHSIH
jgi:hypothetical protein